MNEESAADDILDAGSEGAEALQLPPDSDIKIERFPDGLTIQVPPAGLRRGSQGLFTGAVIVLIVMSLITAAMMTALLNGKVEGKNAALIVPAFLSVFWLTGIGLLLASINMGRRKAAIAVTGGTLMVIQTGLFGSKQRHWEPGDVEAVRAGPSNVTVNNKALLELQIFDGGADKFTLLCGRSDEELRWMASELRSVLGVPDRPS